MAGNGQEVRLQARYKLSGDEFASLTAELFDRFGPAMKRAIEAEQTSMCIAIEGADPLADLCRHIEWRAFETLADNLPPETMADEYGPYEDQSMFFLGVDLEAHAPLAALRIITGVAGVGPPTKSIRDAVLHEGYRSLPDEVIDLTDNVEPVGQWELTCGEVASFGLTYPQRSRRAAETAHQMRPGTLIFDVGTLARLPGVEVKEAGMLWTPLLVAGALRLAEQLHVEHAVTFVTVDLVKALRRLCGAPWRDLEGFGEVVYVPGDPFNSQPSYLNVAELRQSLRGRRSPTSRRPIPEARLDRFAHDPDTDSAFVL